MKTKKKKTEKGPKLCPFERPLRPICLKKEEVVNVFPLDGEDNPFRLMIEAEVLPPFAYKIFDGKLIQIDSCLLCLINGKPGLRGIDLSNPKTVFASIEHYERINATVGITRSTWEFVEAEIANPEVAEKVYRDFEHQRQDLIRDMQKHGYPVDMTIHRSVRDS